MPDQLTDLHQIPFKGNLLSATPGHGSLQHLNVPAWQKGEPKIGAGHRRQGEEKMK
jgi:hypothetical protein